MKIDSDKIYPLVAFGNDGLAAGNKIDTSRIVMEWLKTGDGPPEWMPFGCVQSLIAAEDYAIAVRILYHGPMVAPDQVISTIPVFDSNQARLYETCVYLLDPKKTRIWVMPDDATDAQQRQLVWPKQTQEGLRLGQHAYESREHGEPIELTKG